MSVQYPINEGAYSVASISIASSGDNTVISAVAGKTIRIYRLFLGPASATTIQYKDGASTDMTGVITYGAAPVDIQPGPSGRPIFTLTSGNAFIIELGGAVQVSGFVHFTQN